MPDSTADSLSPLAGRMPDAGRELDALVAEKVMGFRPALTTMTAYPRHFTRADMPDHHQETPHYSTDIAAAWTVVAEMERRGFSCVIATNACSNGHQNGAKFFEGFRGLGFDIFDGGEHKGHHAVDDTVPLAICRAALQAVEVPRG